MDPQLPLAAPTASAYGAWLSVLVIGLLAVAVVGGALVAVRLVTRVVDRITDSKQRLSTYECGEAPVGSAWFRFNNRFTTVALTFLIFDVELALLWPILPRCLDWVGNGQALAAFIEITAFAGSLAIGLAWVAAGGGFIWDRKVSDD
ncbi:MAG TPA: NADH-quinone oxidoreductase subunit A [Planctomycetes bacterium]|nr:NADH-quinone oxidoreductase subunit A [Planctomycetota bacterium]